MDLLKFFNPLELLSCVTDYAFYTKFKPLDPNLNSRAFNREIDKSLTTLLNSDFDHLSTPDKVVYLKAFFVSHVR